jgi:hypothetical protein
MMRRRTGLLYRSDRDRSPARIDPVSLAPTRLLPTLQFPMDHREDGGLSPLVSKKHNAAAIFGREDNSLAN